jgi:hypothetical protein
LFPYLLDGPLQLRRWPLASSFAQASKKTRTEEFDMATYTPEALLKMTTAELDKLFADAPPGPIPNGEAQGTALIDPGTTSAPEIAKVINHFGWQGKVFDAANGTLVNHIGAFGMKAILAEVYPGQSLIDKKPCIVLDYSKTSFVAQRIRDEIRNIAPNTYLGPVYWDEKKLFYFSLHFGAARNDQ